MRRVLATAALLAAIAVAVAVPPAAPAAPLPCQPWSMRTVAEGLGSLENVLPDGRGGLLVSASDQRAIVRLTPDGQSSVLIPGVASPGGMRIRDGVLYFNTGDSAQAGALDQPTGTIDTFDLASGARATFASGLYMPNGLAELPGGDFVTSRDIGSSSGITRVPFADPSHPQFRWADVPDSNGMAVDPTGTYLYFVETFTSESAVYRVTIANPSKVEKITTLGGTVPPKGLDDMTIDGSGLLYIAANGSGEVVRLDPADQSSCVIAAGMRNTSAVKFGSGPGWPQTHLYVVGFDGVVRELIPPNGSEPVPVGSTPPPAPPPPRLTLRAQPATIAVGRRSCVRLTAIAQGRRVREATVTFARRVKGTDSHGNATFCVRPRRAGLLIGRVTKGSLRAARATVRVRGASPTASASKSCSLSPTQQRHSGSTYLLALSVKGLSCSKGMGVQKAFQSCRHGTAGHRSCARKVSGHKCRQAILSSSKTQYDAKVSCTRGSKAVKFTYTQNT